VSTGTPSILYGQETPLGVFHIISKNKRERKPRYHPMYIRTWGNLAIHGYEYVPARNVSHGCIRITKADMDEFHDLIPVGTTVYIYE
jgi:lipoprotein-anchoring transpeptidase ErfK/SrfK